MTTTNGTRKILDLKRWEMACPAPTATVAASFIASSRHAKQQQLYVVNATTAYLYNPYEDGWSQLPSPALGGTFGAGACGVSTAVGPTGTATAGSTTSITTNLTLVRDLRGYSVHFTAGTNAGLTLVIAGNTIGTNAVIRFTTTQGVAFDNTSAYRLLTPRWYVLNAIASAGTTTANVFKYYDFALNVWAAAETGATDGVAPAAVIGTDGRLVCTPSWIDTGYKQFSSGTLASATATTFTVSGKTWATNQWANWAQVRIVSGTGAGQIRRIASNTGNVGTVSTWTVTPDGTSTYSIEGDDDSIYYMGSNAVTLYRYSISGGTWSTLSPGVARSGAPGAGMSGHWIWGCTETDWTDESAIQNGKYIYSVRAGGGTAIDRYDIAANSWSVVTYSPWTEFYTTGAKYVYSGDALYIQKDITGRWFRFDIPRSNMDGWGWMGHTQGAAILGDTAFDVTYRDGATEIVFVHSVLNTSNVHLRCMVI